MRKSLPGLLAITVLMLGIFFLRTEARAESITTTPFFHLSKVKGGEFYTADLAEKKEMIRNHGYADMGVACYIAGPETDQFSDLVPLYRLKFTGDYEGTTFSEYFYTTDQNEVDDYIDKSGWSSEGTSGYVIDKNSSLAGTVPLYRWYCPSAYHWHGYSRDRNDTWITKLHQGAEYEGIACRVWTKECSVEVSDSDLDAPYDLKAVSSDGKVRLTWKNPLDDETDISIERKTSNNSFHEIATVEGEDTNYTDDSVSSNTSYTYRVRAWRDGQSSQPSNEARVYTDQDYTDNDENDFWDRHHKGILEDLIEPEAPSNLKTSVLSYSSIRLTWDSCSFPALGYRVERKSNSGSYVTVANLHLGARTFTDTGLDRDTRYYYRVRAYNLFEDSDYSEEVSVCTSSDYDNTDDDWWSDDEDYDQTQSLVIKLQIGSRKYYVNHTFSDMDTVPFISGERTFVPIRFLAESIGANVDWDDYERKATISNDGEVIELWAGRNTARVNGSRNHIDALNSQLTPVIKQGRIMLPLRFITENLGFDVDWNDASREIILTYSPLVN
ncbi:MAG TPA: stalk domain-containing protein [Syntrophomonadaceae bacterium]|nr:stalk domain-containing protein [Syntrophomonadaceae bacterium]